MRITAQRMTARQAADHFAETAWEQPRKVGKWKHAGVTPCFQLVRGSQWYSVDILPHGEGWEIAAIMQPT
jgi:uncharacterized membrane-anchored protein